MARKNSQILNHSSTTLLLSSLVCALVMLQGICCFASTLDTIEHDDSTPADPTVTVRPREIKDVLYNPGMGLADFHFGFGHPPSNDEYPRQTVYFRWSWSDLEPEEGQYAFDFVDRIISQAKEKGETLAFRIMTDYKVGSPAWLLNKGVGSVAVGRGIFPDYNNPTFLQYHEKLIKAFGERYAGSPDIDHVDIGSVGCWGEWNMACCQGVEAQCKQYYPVEDNAIKITEWYLKYFAGTPLVMLKGGPSNTPCREAPVGEETVSEIMGISVPHGTIWSTSIPGRSKIQRSQARGRCSGPIRGMRRHAGMG